MNIILLGPPGAGKGTQAKKIASKCGVPHISTGDMFREASESGSDLGKKLQSYMTTGKLVPDELVIEIVTERLSKMDCNNGFLLDGFPRTFTQAKSLGQVLNKSGKTIDKVIAITVDEEEVVRRLSSRRVCVSCGAAFNLMTQPPNQDGKCDVCGGKVIQRADDNEQTIRKRLEVYKGQTGSVTIYYSRMKILFEVNGSQPVEKVFKDICDAIEE